LIESQFGAGLDWYILNSRFALSAEAFDFNRDPRPQFRLYGRIYPVKNLYLLVGLDDFPWPTAGKYSLAWVWS